MHIGHFITSRNLSYGGPVVAMAGLAKEQAASNQVSIFYEHKPDHIFSPLDHYKPVHVPSLGLLKNGKSQERMDRLIADADILHLHGIWEDIQYHAACAAKRKGIPYVIRTCGMLDPWSLANKSKWKKKVYIQLRLGAMLRNAGGIHFTTQREAELAAPFTRPEQVIVEPNGIDLSEYEELPRRGDLRRKLSIGEKPMVLFLGRIAPKKGLDILLPAFARLDNPEAVLVIAGPDEAGYVQNVRAMAEALGIKDRIFYTGPIHGEEKLHAMVDADLFALTSYQENFGNAVLEAMACGTPVLVSDQVNICDEVSAAKTGSVISLDIAAAAKALQDLLNQPEATKQLGQNGRALASERFSWHQIAARWNDHYQQLVKS